MVLKKNRTKLDYFSLGAFMSLKSNLGIKISLLESKELTKLLTTACNDADVSVRPKRGRGTTYYTYPGYIIEQVLEKWVKSR